MKLFKFGLFLRSAYVDSYSAPLALKVIQQDFCGNHAKQAGMIS
jgi:hypothetical protein